MYLIHCTMGNNLMWLFFFLFMHKQKQCNEPFVDKTGKNGYTHTHNIIIIYCLLRRAKLSHFLDRYFIINKLNIGFVFFFFLLIFVNIL